MADLLSWLNMHLQRELVEGVGAPAAGEPKGERR